MRKDEELTQKIVISNEAELKVLSAMEQQAIAFGKYFRDNVVLDGAPKMYHRPTKTRLNMEQIYQIFNNPTNGE